MSEKEKNVSSVKDARITVIICAVVIAFAVLFVIGLVFYPQMRAASELKKYGKMLDEPLSCVYVSNPLWSDSFEGGIGEFMLDGDACREFVAEIASAVKGADYSSRRDTFGEAGGVKLLFRLESGESVILFVYPDNDVKCEISFIKGGTSFFFSLPDEFDFNKLIEKYNK